MKVILNFRSDFYELFIDHKKIVFTTDDIRFIKIDKSLNINSIVHFNLLILVLFVIFLELIYFPFLFFLALSISILFFLTIMYKPIYHIQLNISHEQFLIETTDKELYIDFVMLNHFHVNGNDYN
jgi:hypothetical protein